MRAPDYSGGGLVNLVAELEHRLTGDSIAPRLYPEIASSIPDADGYVLVLIDALGDLQLAAHPRGGTLLDFRRAALDSSFSTQTSVAISTIATGRPPASHGLLSYVLKVDEGPPVNTLWWFRVDGSPLDIDLDRFLPHPTLAERLERAGVEAVVVQPSAFLGSPLGRVLYRGAEAKGVSPDEDVAEIGVASAAPGRLTVVYIPDIDAAGHAEGTFSDAYTGALAKATAIWEGLVSQVPENIAVIGTADHGMVNVPPDHLVVVSTPPTITLAGDARVLYAYGPARDARALTSGLPATWVEAADAMEWWGPSPPVPAFVSRLPRGLIVADEGFALHAPGNELPMVGYHGGITEAELRIPLLVRAR